MKTYYVMLTITKAIEVNAETEEQAIEIVKSQLDPREAMRADIQVAQEVEPIKE